MEFYTKNRLAEKLLREAIAKGELRRGERLRQMELAKKLGISATPIREALSRLAAQGLVVHEPNKGVRVADVRPEEAYEIYLIRGVLEALATEVATPRLGAQQLARLEEVRAAIEVATAAGRLEKLQGLNYDFHFTIYEAAGMPHLRQMIEVLWTQYPWDTLYVIPGRAEASYLEHCRILAALRVRDASAAAAAMREHISNGCEAVKRYLDAQEAGEGREPRRPAR